MLITRSQNVTASPPQKPIDGNGFLEYTIKDPDHKGDWFYISKYKDGGIRMIRCRIMHSGTTPEECIAAYTDFLIYSKSPTLKLTSTGIYTNDPYEYIGTHERLFSQGWVVSRPTGKTYAITLPQQEALNLARKIATDCYRDGMHDCSQISALIPYLEKIIRECNTFEAK